MPKKKVFTAEESKQLINLIYGSNPGERITHDDIEAHFTLYLAAKDIKVVGKQTPALLNKDIERLKAQYIKDMQDHSPFTVKGGLMTRQKTVDKEVEKRKQWHCDLIKNAEKNTYYYANTRPWFLNGISKEKKTDPGFLQSKKFGEDEQTVYAQSLYLKNKLPSYVTEDPTYAAPQQKDESLDYAKKFFHMIELFYRPISLLADPNPEPDPKPGENHTLNHYCLAKLYFDELIKVVGTPTTKDLIERDTIHTDKKKMGYLEKINSDLEMRSVFAPNGISTLTPDECKIVMRTGLDTLAEENFGLYKKALSGLKSAVPFLNIEEKLEKVEKEQIADNSRVKNYNDMHQWSVDRIQNKTLLTIRVDAKKAASIRSNLGDEYSESMDDLVKSLDVNSRTTQQAKDFAKQDIETGAALFMEFSKEIRTQEEPYLQHDEIKKVLGNTPDHMQQYKVRIPSQGIKQYTDLRSAYNKIAEKNGCAKLTDSPEDDKKLKAFTFSLLLRDGVSLRFTPLVMKDHMVPALGEPVEVATDSKILSDIQREAKRQRMQAEDERWNAKAEEDTKRVTAQIRKQEDTSFINDETIRSEADHDRRKEHSQLKEELNRLFPSLERKKKALGGYRNQSLVTLRNMVGNMINKLDNGSLSDEERIDGLIQIRDEAERLKGRKTEAAGVLKIVQAHLGNKFNLDTITRLEEEADRKEMEAQNRKLESFAAHKDAADNEAQLSEKAIAEREKMQQIMDQPYVKEADAVMVQARQNLDQINRGHYTSEKEFEANKTILTKAASEMIAASLLKRVGMQTMFYEKDMNDGRSEKKSLSLQEINENMDHRQKAANALEKARQNEADEIWNKIVKAKENQSEERQRQLANMLPEEKQREIRMAEIRTYADEIRKRPDFKQMMSTVTDWESLDEMKTKVTGGKLIDELARHAKLVTAEEKKRDLEAAAQKKADEAKHQKAAAPKQPGKHS